MKEVYTAKRQKVGGGILNEKAKARSARISAYAVGECDAMRCNAMQCDAVLCKHKPKKNNTEKRKQKQRKKEKRDGSRPHSSWRAGPLLDAVNLDTTVELETDTSTRSSMPFSAPARVRQWFLDSF